MYRNLIKLNSFLFILAATIFMVVVFGLRPTPVLFAKTTAPALPKVRINTTYPTLSALRTVWAVKASCAGVPNCTTSLQNAIDGASPGDEIVVDVDLSIEGPIKLKEKTSGSGWIVIRSANLSNLPKAGNRISPADSPNMPKIVSPGQNQSALVTEDRARNYRIVGIEFKEKTPDDDSNTLVQIGPTHSYCATAEDRYAFCPDLSALKNYPSDIILDRVYIHGDPGHNVKRGLGLDAKSSAIIDSYISDIHVVGQDSQAIAGLYGPGPYKIANNYLEGSTENLIFGGDNPRMVNLVPSDIEITGNYFFKPLSWKKDDASYGGKHWAVKNLLELKNAKRVLIEGNIMENSWKDGQTGFAVLFTVRSQGGECYWCTVSDVTFRNNIVRHAGAGVQFLGHDNTSRSGPTERIKVSNNLWEDIDKKWGGDGKWVTVDGGTKEAGPSDVELSHNTVLQSGTFLSASSYYASDNSYSTKPDFIITDNIAFHNKYGIIGDHAGIGNDTLRNFFPGVRFTGNILIGGRASSYNSYSGNYFPSGSNDIFMNYAAGDYRLASGSPYMNAGTDGGDTGADMDAVNKATAHAKEGIKNVQAAVPSIVPDRMEQDDDTSIFIPTQNIPISRPTEDIPTVWSASGPGVVEPVFEPVQAYSNWPEVMFWLNFFIPPLGLF